MMIACRMQTAPTKRSISCPSGNTEDSCYAKDGNSSLPAQLCPKDAQNRPRPDQQQNLKKA